MLLNTISGFFFLYQWASKLPPALQTIIPEFVLHLLEQELFSVIYKSNFFQTNKNAF